ncbi:hypothetical protein RF11_16482 [Thelohanellus kitauei]|uniref:Uncharacterized protein n=1 Tax=Thelohanellus kitauei TaxID=669202 RepID=A0A0C2JSQ8_THEKT|nr:hypothetical protein RF11_16482 [Thelohanellus kitauei]
MDENDHRKTCIELSQGEGIQLIGINLLEETNTVNKTHSPPKVWQQSCQMMKHMFQRYGYVPWLMELYPMSAPRNHPVLGNYSINGDYRWCKCLCSSFIHIGPTKRLDAIRGSTLPTPQFL